MTVTEDEEFGTCVDGVVFCIIALNFSQLTESEGIKLVGCVPECGVAVDCADGNG